MYWRKIRSIPYHEPKLSIEYFVSSRFFFLFSFFLVFIIKFSLNSLLFTRASSSTTDPNSNTLHMKIHCCHSFLYESFSYALELCFRFIIIISLMKALGPSMTPNIRWISSSMRISADGQSRYRPKFAAKWIHLLAEFEWVRMRDHSSDCIPSPNNTIHFGCFN